MRGLLAVALLGAAFAAAPAPVHAQRDSVEFFSNLHVGPDETVHDAVCFFCNARIEGKASGDVVVLFGAIHLSGQAQHDVVSLFGSVRADSNSSIQHDFVSLFGTVRMGDNVTVGHDMVTMFGSLHAPASLTVGGDRVFLSNWIFFGPLLVIFLVIWLIFHEIGAHRRRWAPGVYPPPPQP